MLLEEPSRHVSSHVAGCRSIGSWRLRTAVREEVKVRAVIVLFEDRRRRVGLRAVDAALRQRDEHEE